MILQFWAWCFGHPKGDTGFPLVSNCANVLTVESEGNYISPLTNTDCGSWMLLGPCSLSSLFKALFPPLLFSLYLPVAACLTTQSCPTLCDPWTIACQAPLSTGFCRQEYWSRLPFPSPGDLPDPGIEPASPALAGRFFTTEPPGKPL